MFTPYIAFRRLNVWEKIKTLLGWIGFIALAIAGLFVGRKFRLSGNPGTADRVADDAEQHRESLERVRDASRDTTAAIEGIEDTADGLDKLARRGRKQREEIADLDSRIEQALSGSSHDWDSIDDIGD